jgi:hypothetical protein
VQPQVEVFRRIEILLLCINKQQQACTLNNNKSNQTMNHLLHQISWQQYLSVTLVTAIIYYLFVILRCYRPELENLQRQIQGNKQDDQLQALQYQPTEEEAITVIPTPTQSQYPQEEQTISDTDILAAKLKPASAQPPTNLLQPPCWFPN